MITSRPSFVSREQGLSPAQLQVLKEPIRIPPGHGLRMIGPEERAKRLTNEYLGKSPAPSNTLLVWEPPRKGFLYVVSADISSGMQLDNSVIDVTRVGTMRECDEQVAQFVTNEIDETDLAYVIAAIGRFYRGKDDQDALVGIECNGMGLSTQNELQKHIGYTNLFIWEYLDAVDGKGLTNRYGWYTTQRTRPLILQDYMHALKSVDPNSGYPDYRINSPHTMNELSDFQSPNGALWAAEATDGAHDDCIMAGAIGVHIARTLQRTRGETVQDARKRVMAEAARAERIGELRGQQVSFQTMDMSHAQMMGEELDPYGEPVHNPFDGDPEIDHYL